MGIISRHRVPTDYFKNLHNAILPRQEKTPI